MAVRTRRVGGPLTPLPSFSPDAFGKSDAQRGRSKHGVGRGAETPPPASFLARSATGSLLVSSSRRRENSARKRGGGFLAGPSSGRSAGDSPQRREAKCGTSAAGSSSPDFWLSAAVVKRRRPKYFRLRDPEWRSDMAVRLGFPVLGAVAAVAFAWLMIKA